jgi:hypothetical protein
MRSTFIAIVAALLVGCKTTPDPIEHFVTNYAASSGVWIRDLSAEAKSEQVIKQTFARMGYGTSSGEIRQETIYKISRIRRVQVHIPGSLPGIYTEALVETELGARIILFRYEGPKDGWWSQVWFYDANYYKKPSAS